MKKIIIKTDRLNTYKRGDEIIIDSLKEPKGVYRALFTLVENGEADVAISPDVKKEMEKKTVKKTVKKAKKK